MSKTHAWAFRSGFRRNSFGWRGSRKAIERMEDAVVEIRRVAGTDPALAGEGAVILLQKLSPALADVDSSSGALGSATAAVVEELVPIIVAAPVSGRVRDAWLDRLFDAYQDDDPPYIESLGEHWGELCVDADRAGAWADRLLPLVQSMMADRRRGAYAYAKADTLCYAALFKAERFDELLQVLDLDPRPFWRDRQWASRVLAVRGDVDGAVRVLEDLRGRHAPDGALCAMAEQLLLDAGRTEEAYSRFGIIAGARHTNIATFRAIAKRYPTIEPRRILDDLVASTPGEEGKWFATAKTLKQYELAIALARRSAVDPKTLVRAARDHVKGQPAFALEAALLALYWMAAGAGYDLTASDVSAAREHVLAASEALGQESLARSRIAEFVAGNGPAALWVRQWLGIEAGSSSGASRGL